ncbi:MAG: S9 family peptidase [Bacilli bacterium]|nr:S9 family peptidase [Bacilli bacterium]
MDEEKKRNIATWIGRAAKIIDATSKVGAEVATTFLFDRRQLDPEKYKKTLNYLLYLNRDDFPLMKDRKDYSFMSGKNRLVGHYYHVENAKALVIYVHGIGSYSDDLNAAAENFFIERGYSVFALDLTASGYSEGESIDGLHQSAYDVAACVKTLSKHPYFSKYRLCLVGHSWGAFGVTAALNFVDEPVAIVELSGFYQPDVVMVSLAHGKAGYFADLNKNYLDTANENRSGNVNPYLSAVEGINKASKTHILLVHGTHDHVIDYKRASIISQKRYIKNRHVEILSRDRDHGDIFFSLNAIEAVKQARQLAETILLTPYKKLAKVPSDVLEDYKLKISRAANTELDQELFNHIDNFLTKALR